MSLQRRTKQSGIRLEFTVSLVRRLFGLHHLGFWPFALTKSLNADQVNAFASKLFHEADSFVLYIFYSVTRFKFWRIHTSIVCGSVLFQVRYHALLLCLQRNVPTMELMRRL
jgi:hypothetical protein